MAWLSDLKGTVQKFARVEHPRAERRPASGLAARYGLDSTSAPAVIKNISDTGIYLVTEKRLRTGESITLTLAEEGEPENGSDLQITVHARVARQGDDGIGLSFVLPPGMDTNLWAVLVRNIVVLTDQSQIAQMFRTLRAILFLCRICGSEAEEAILLLGGHLDADRTAAVVKIAISAENLLASEPDADRMRAHPKLVASILREGSWSWSVDEVVMQLWVGLLVSSCSLDAPDDSNQLLVNLLIHMTPNHAKILIHGCKRELDSDREGENSPSASIILNMEEMVALTGQPDITRNATTVAHLFYLGMIPKNFNFTSYLFEENIESFNITPTRLALTLFKHCHGNREKIEPQLVEEATAHLVNFAASFNASAPDKQTSR